MPSPGMTRDRTDDEIEVDRESSARERAKTERRRRILETVEALIRRDGEVSFSMRSLAEQANLSPATPFNLFGSKSALLRALIERTLNKELQSLETVHDEAPFERVLGLAERIAATFTDDELYRPLVDAYLRTADPTGLQRLFERSTALWRLALGPAEAAGLLDPDLDRELLARQLHLVFRAAQRLWLTRDIDDRSFQLQIQYGFTLVLLGAATSPAREALRARLLAVQTEITAHRIRTIASVGRMKKLQKKKKEEERA